MSLYKCYAKLRQTEARYQKQNYLKTAQWDYEKGGKFWSQFQLVNCMRENESQGDSRKILQLIMLGYIVFLLFVSIQRNDVSSLKMLQILRNYWICDYTPEISLGTEIFDLHAFKACQPPKRKAETVLAGLGGQLCAGSTGMKIARIFGLLGIKHKWTTFHLREIKDHCTNHLLSLKFSQGFFIADSSGRNNLATNVKSHTWKKKKSCLQFIVTLLQLPPPGEQRRPAAAPTASTWGSSLQRGRESYATGLSESSWGKALPSFTPRMQPLFVYL